ncbi:caspase family protein [Endozoicomonas sp. ALB091]|uniref:caspase family protein n=1 Tax=Endozoicomonas sp. ALB091 TaxID=3403073 RepID=UPI003BB6DDEF
MLTFCIARIQHVVFSTITQLICLSLILLSPLNAYCSFNSDLPDNQTVCYDNQCPLDTDFYFEFENMHLIKGLFTGQNYDQIPEVPTLGGCRNDAWNFFNWASTSKGIPTTSLKVQTDRSGPLKKSIVLAEIERLAEQTHSEAGPHRIIISFSGHGTRRPDTSGDESDHMDELLVCGRDVISDDELHHAFKRFHNSTRLLIFVDTCHSGTMFDLPYRYVYNSLHPDIIEEIDTGRDRDIPAYMMVVSASRDRETAADAFLPSPGIIAWSSQGDFSHRMIKTLKEVYYHNLYVRNIPALLRDQKLHADVRYNPNQHAVLSTNFRPARNLKLFGW